jgi:hypothetical protein
MPDNIIRTKGRPKGYKFDRGGMPAEFGPFIGLVRNNIDPTRSGRLQVYIEQFAGDDPNDESLWRTVSYVPPFYGTTNPGPNAQNTVGTFTSNPQSYGMWFTPPDINTAVICFFVEGDPNQGYYLGCIPDIGINRMIPSIGAVKDYQLERGPQDQYFAGATQLPVTEINPDNQAISQDPRFFDQTKPVHSYLAGILLQQGLIRDTVRGPITSSSQRETPSSVYGISTPGKPIFQGGLSERDIKARLDRGDIRPQDIDVIARRGGHSIVMDDGDLEGRDNLVRIRTAKGHQITMSDDGDCFYIIHANGQTWIELGKQGTVDVFSTNSVNVRTQGTINLHADRDINMFAGGAINMKSTVTKIEASASLDLIGSSQLKLYSKNSIGVRSDGTLALKNSNAGSWDAGSALTLKAGCINLNSGAASPVIPPKSIAEKSLADTSFIPNKGWEVEFGKLKTIVTRAPTHEPYPYHNQGVSEFTDLDEAIDSAALPGVAAVLGGLADIPVLGGITASDFLGTLSLDGVDLIGLGNLDTTQIGGLLAQAQKDIGQAFDQFSLEKGIGAFGFSPAQLESTGFLKPGTVQNFLSSAGADIENVLKSASVWTGKAGIDNLTNLLGDAGLQALTQNEIMIGALDGLKAAGIVTGKESSTVLGSLVQTATKYGVDTAVEWVKGVAPADLVESINQTAKNAQYAVNFVDTKASELVTSSQRLGGFTNTVLRDGVDLAVKQVINNPKIPLPDFSTGLYSGTPDSSLTYSGDDPIVLARVNGERERRGLPPLT